MKKIFTIALLLLIISVLKTQAQFIYPNDVCSGAMPLQISNSSQLQDTFYLSHEFADPALSSIPHCNGSTNQIRQDLWYSFIASDTTLSLVTKLHLNNGTINYQLFTGSCGSLSSLSCYSGLLNNKLTGLVIGQQYYLRSYTGGINFTINLVAKPVNDDCGGALELPLFSAITAGSKMNRFTNELATKTTAGCTASNTGWSTINDVWYKFTATAATHPISIGTLANSGTKCSVYGGSLGSLSVISSFNFVSSFEVRTLTNLVPGATYYIRIGAPGIVNFTIGIYKDAPANDECINADTVLMSSSFKCENNFSISNRLTATNSTGNCSLTTTKDVWFIFKATSADITVRAQEQGSSAINLGLLQGSCGALSCLVNTSEADFSYSGLIVGNYYFLQVGGGQEDRQVSICISPKNTNNECSSATLLPIKPYNQLRNNIAYFHDATQSLPACNSSYEAKDLWYQFTAADTACLITIDGENAQFQVLSGVCGMLNSIHCSSLNQLPMTTTERTEKISGLTAGTLYYLRMYPTNASSKTLYTIDVNALPSNDECAGAILLQPQQGLAYEPLADNGILQATESLPPCIATFARKDIWYQFTATSSSAAIMSHRESGNGPSTVMGFQLYSGGCGSLTSIACFNQGTLLHKGQTITNLIAGQTYYIRQYGNFEKNRISVVNAPANDEMAGAIKLAPSPANVQSIPSYYSHGASRKFGKLCAASTNLMNHDVWFYFIAEAATHSVSINSANTFWPEEITGYFYSIEAFRGYAADSLLLRPKFISCANNNSPLSLTGLTAGDTVYLRVANASAAGNTSIFSVKITATQNMNEPAGALLLSTLDEYQYSVTTTGATQSLPAAGCLMPDFPDDDIWFKFTAASTIKRIIAGLESRDVTMQLFSGTPGNLTAVLCSNNIMVLPASLTNGTQYYLRVYSKANAQSASFKIGLFDEATLSANECISNISLLGPNLIVNPRCESEEMYLLPTITLGTGYAGKKLTKGWWGASEATPDTWNADYPRVGFGNVPNDAGYGFNKIPRSGKGMIGIMSTYFGDAWSEYITGRLNQPLTKGKTYFVSFYINFADVHSKTAFNIGAHFNNDSIHTGLGTAPLEVAPQITYNAVTANAGANGWRNICGYVYADKAYTFITIGNFGNHSLYSAIGYTYIFIDDVMVAETTPQVLPLRLLDFNGRMNAQQQSELQWTTGSETSTKHFEVQWRTDTKPFTVIGTVQAAGNSTTDKHYNFLHRNPEAGNNYYRLKMMDIDGRFTYSPIVKTGLSLKANKLSVHPNPVSSALNVMATIEKDEMVFFRIVSNDGRTVATNYRMLRKGSNAFSWNISNLAAGNYFLVSTNTALQPIHIVKQ